MSSRQLPTEIQDDATREAVDHVLQSSMPRSLPVASGPPRDGEGEEGELFLRIVDGKLRLYIRAERKLRYLEMTNA